MPRNPTRTALVTLLTALGSLTVAGCASNATPDTAAIAAYPDPGLQPGDVIRLAVWRQEDLSGEFAVDDRGVVTLPLLGERRVEGLDGPTLRDDLLDSYREYLRTPSIEVTVLRRVHILGAVNEPGLYPVDATISLGEAIGVAGGVSPTGDLDDIRLARDESVVRNLQASSPLSAVDVRSGDRIFVGEKSWLKRNPGALVGSLVAAAAGITIALLR